VVNDPEGNEVDSGTYGEQFGRTGDGRGWFPSNFVEEEEEGSGFGSRVSRKYSYFAYSDLSEKYVLMVPHPAA
jgi:hypothetical protein